MASTVAAPAVNALNASQNVLDSFWNLAAPEEAKRLAAAEALVEELLAGQAEHAKSAAAADSSAAAGDGEPVPKHMRQEVALRRCSPLMVYTLRRLIRGLGSGRHGARQGFATALALLLGKQAQQAQQQQEAFLDAADTLVLLDTCLEATSSMKASDAREVLVGKLFGLGALVQSGLLLAEAEAGQPAPAAAGAAEGRTPGKGKKGSGPAPAAAAAPLALGACVTCAKQLLALGSSRSFLREAAAATLLELTWALGPEGAGQLLQQSEELQAALKVAPKDATPEALLLALCFWPVMTPELRAAVPLLPSCPAPAAAVFFPPHAQQQEQTAAAASPPALSAACCDALFSTSYLQTILPALKGTISSNPKLHSLWSVLLPLLLPSMAGTGAGAGAGATASRRHMAAFWEVVVEKGLLVTPSHERKFLALKLFQSVLKHLGPDHVSVVFSTNFTKTLLGNLRNKDNYLHAAATRCMDMVTAFAEGASGEGGSTRLAVMAALQKLGVRKDGGGKVEAAAAAAAAVPLDSAAIAGYLGHLEALFLRGAAEAGADPVKKAGKKAGAVGEGEEAAEAEKRAEAESQRAYAVEQLCTVARFSTAAAGDVLRVLRFLATHAFLEVEAKAGGAGGKKKGKKAAEVAEEVVAAAAAAVPVSGATRRLCAQRLAALLAAQAPHRQPGGGKSRKPAADGADDGDEAPEQPAREGPKIAGQLLEFIQGSLLPAADAEDAGISAKLVSPLGPEQDVAMSLLREVEQALVAAAAGPAAPAAAGQDRGPAARGMLHLVRLLQVHLLGDAECVDPDLAVGLRRIAREGLGVQLPDMEVQGEKEEEAEGEEEEKEAPWQDVMVDVLLSLLSRPASLLPTSGLRDAIDSIWRGLATCLTAQGMRDLVRVVVAGVDREADGVDVLDEDEEEVEVEEGEEDDEEEEEEEGGKGGKRKAPESDLEEEEGSEGEEEEGGDSEGDDDDDDDDADDAEMFRMDAKMAAYLRGMVDARKGVKERKQALANLRLRALALIESFAKKVPNSPLLPAVVLPLTRALRIARRTNSGPEQSDISRRLQAVVQGICASGRAAPAGPLSMPVSELTENLRRCLRYATRERDRVAAQVAGQVWCLLLRTGAAAEGDEAVAAAAASYAAGLRDTLHKRTRLHKSTLEEATLQALPASIPSIPDLIRGCSTARSMYAQVEALQLLARLLRPPSKRQQQQLDDATEGFGPAVSDLHTALMDALTENRQAVASAVAAAAAGMGMKKQVHAEAVKAAVAVLEGVRRLFNRRLAEVLGPESILSVTKAVATVKDIGVTAKVATQLERLVTGASLTELLAKTEPDAALRSKLVKAQAKQGQEQKQKQEGAAAEREGKKAAGKKGGKEGGKGKEEKKGKKGGKGSSNGEMKAAGKAGTSATQPKEGKRQKTGAEPVQQGQQEKKAAAAKPTQGKGSKGPKVAAKEGPKGLAAQPAPSIELGKRGAEPAAAKAGGKQAKKAKNATS